jgi:hypothetical protein
MPECAALYLVEYLIELGVTYGEQSLLYSEIESWQRQSGVELQPWEARVVKHLSEAYLSESHAARDPDAKAPWSVVWRVVPVPTGSGGLMDYFKDMR